MSYSGYRRIFNDYDGRTRVVIQDPVNAQDIANWIKGKPRPLQIANTECPKCGRNTTAAINHTCP